MTLRASVLTLAIAVLLAGCGQGPGAIRETEIGLARTVTVDLARADQQVLEWSFALAVDRDEIPLIQLPFAVNKTTDHESPSVGIRIEIYANGALAWARIHDDETSGGSHSLATPTEGADMDAGAFRDGSNEIMVKFVVETRKPQAGRRATVEVSAGPVLVRAP